MACSNTATINYGNSIYSFSLVKTGTQWCYTVVVTGAAGPTAPGLSHFILELCDRISTNPDSDFVISNITVSINGVAQTPDYEIKLHTIDDGTGRQVYGIKFDNGVDKGETGVFCFNITPDVQPVAGDLVVKGGNNPELLTVDAICTPSCTPPQPPTPGRGLCCNA